jgi:hypothetical protein
MEAVASMVEAVAAAGARNRETRMMLARLRAKKGQECYEICEWQLRIVFVPL